MTSNALKNAPAAASFQLRDAAWHEQSIQRALQHWDGRADLWVFGYGSLIWRPEFDFIEARMARIHGYHRALCLWSRVNRGTPKRPGLVFSLDNGGSCHGRVFRLPGATIPATMRALWAREMPSAAYIPRWLNCHTPEGKLSALVFTMDRKNDGYVAGLDLEQTIEIILQADPGKYGSCPDYVLQTAAALQRAGIHDRRLENIAAALRASLAA